MKQLRILGVALLALFALSAVAASMASAEEGVLEKATTFTIAGGTAKLLNLEKEEIVCKETAGSGTFETGSDQKATGTFTFKKCTALGLAANSLGSGAGEITSKVTFLVCLTEPKALQFGFLITPTETVHVEVPSVKELLLVKGATLGSLSKAGELEGTTFEVGFKEEDKHIECEINSKKFASSFEAGIDTKPDSDAFELGTGTVTFPKTIKFMDK